MNVNQKFETWYREKTGLQIIWNQSAKAYNTENAQIAFEAWCHTETQSTPIGYISQSTCALLDMQNVSRIYADISKDADPKMAYPLYLSDQKTEGRLDEAETLLAQNLSAWEDEEESVQDEHQDLISDTKKHLKKYEKV